MDEHTEPTKTEEKKKPTREQIRSNNRETRLQNGWANVCPVASCKRTFTSKNGFLNHLANYHRMKVETTPAGIKVFPASAPATQAAPASTEAPCCAEGERYARETGAHGDDHPGDCTESAEKPESIKKD